MPAGRWLPAPITGKVPPIPRRYLPSMTVQNQPGAKARIAPAGLLFLAMTCVGWGLNWPITKYVLSEWPPLPARGLTGVVGSITLAIYALARGQSLRLPPDQR